MRVKHISLSRFKLAEPPTPIGTEASNAYAILHDSLGPVCICRLIGINSYHPQQLDNARGDDELLGQCLQATKYGKLSDALNRRSTDLQHDRVVQRYKLTDAMVLNPVFSHVQLWHGVCAPQRLRDHPTGGFYDTVRSKTSNPSTPGRPPGARAGGRRLFMRRGSQARGVVPRSDP